jgi:hypothetical protein
MTYDAGASRLSIMMVYAVGAGIIAFLTVLLVPHQGFVVGDNGLINWRNGAKMKEGAPCPATHADGAVVDDSDDVEMLAGQRPDADETVSTTPSHESQAAEGAGTTDTAVSGFQSLPFSVQARSPRHILLLVIFGTTIARMAFFFSTFTAQLLQWFDAADIRSLSKGFSVIMLSGGFGVFFIGPVLDKYGIAWGFFVTFVTGTLWSVLQFVPSIPVQGVSWAVFALYRAFFFSVIASYMVAVFGYANMGKVYGFCNVVAAMCSIFNNMVRSVCHSTRTH